MKENFESFDARADLYADLDEIEKKNPGHFRGMEFERGKLTDSDVTIWQEIKKGTLTKAELGEYAAEVQEHALPTRMTFLGLVNNRAMMLFSQAELAERRRKRQEEADKKKAEEKGAENKDKDDKEK